MTGGRRWKWWSRPEPDWATKERTSPAEVAQTMPDAVILHSPAANAKTEHFDVLIVGAGISGIGGAYHLQQQCPGKSFVILEAQDSLD